MDQYLEDVQDFYQPLVEIEKGRWLACYTCRCCQNLAREPPEKKEQKDKEQDSPVIFMEINNTTCMPVGMSLINAEEITRKIDNPEVKWCGVVKCLYLCSKCALDKLCFETSVNLKRSAELGIEIEKSRNRGATNGEIDDLERRLNEERENLSRHFWTGYKINKRIYQDEWKLQEEKKVQYFDHKWKFDWHVPKVDVFRPGRLLNFKTGEYHERSEMIEPFT